jgi:hypothetical protein
MGNGRRVLKTFSKTLEEKWRHFGNAPIKEGTREPLGRWPTMSLDIFIGSVKMKSMWENL